MVVPGETPSVNLPAAFPLPASLVASPEGLAVVLPLAAVLLEEARGENSGRQTLAELLEVALPEPCQREHPVEDPWEGAPSVVGRVGRQGSYRDRRGVLLAGVLEGGVPLGVALEGGHLVAWLVRGDLVEDL